MPKKSLKPVSALYVNKYIQVNKLEPGETVYFYKKEEEYLFNTHTTSSDYELIFAVYRKKKNIKRSIFEKLMEWLLLTIRH